MPCQDCSIFVLRKSERPAVWTQTNLKVHKANIFLWVSLNSIKLASYVIPRRFFPVYFVDFSSLPHKMVSSRLSNTFYFTKIAQILRE